MCRSEALQMATDAMRRPHSKLSKRKLHLLLPSRRDAIPAPLLSGS
jgi:hypothetical protein